MFLGRSKMMVEEVLVEGRLRVVKQVIRRDRDEDVLLVNRFRKL